MSMLSDSVHPARFPFFFVLWVVNPSLPNAALRRAMMLLSSSPCAPAKERGHMAPVSHRVELEAVMEKKMTKLNKAMGKSEMLV